MLKYMTRLLAIAFVSNSISAPVVANERTGSPQTEEADVIAYVGARWLDLSKEDTVWSSGDRYSVNGVFVGDPPSAPVRIVDLYGRWIVPPLSDTHNHSVEGVWSQDTAAALVRQGVFYYRNPSNVASEANANGAYWARADTLDVTFSHGAFTNAGDHPEPLYRRLAGLYRIEPDELDGRAFYVMPDVPTLDRRWSDVLADDPDFIKIILLNSNGADGASIGGLPAHVGRRAVELAHASGLRVMAHTWTAGDVETALRIGADEVAHLPGYQWGSLGRESFVINDELARDLKNHGTVMNTTTVVASDEDDSWRDADWQPNPVQKLQRENLKRLIHHGVTLAIGTDQSRPTIDEVDYLRALGVMDDTDLLWTWFRGAGLIFPHRKLGFEPGDEASFLALSCDPFADFDCIRTPMHLEKQGVAISQGTEP